MSERSDHDLESDLRRLFDDERLTVRVAPGARDAVIAGARRVRRRRDMAIAGSGLAVAAVVVAGGVMLIGPQGADQQANVAAPGTEATLSTAASSSAKPKPSRSRVEKEPQQPEQLEVPDSAPAKKPPPKQPSRTPEFRVPTTPAVTSGPIGPTGWARIQLGMSYEDVQQAGYLAEDAAPPQGCTSYPLTAGTDQVSTVVISEAGVGRIVAGANGRTPEGIGIGTPLEQLQNTYPGGTSAEGEYRVDTSVGSTYVFTVPGEGAAVSAFALTNGNC